MTVIPQGATPSAPAVRALADQLRVIIRLAHPYRGRMLASLLLTGIGVLAGLATPLGLKALLNVALAPGGRERSITGITVALLALLVLRAALNVWGGYILRITGERIIADLRIRVYRHLHTLGLRYFASQRVGEITSRLTTDVAAIRSAVTDGAISVILQSVKLAGSVAIMASLNWRLSLLVLVTTPGVTVASRVFGARLRELSRRGQDGIAHATAVAQEALGAIRLVQVNARGPHEVGRYQGAVEQVYTTVRSTSRTSIALGAVVELLFTAATIAIFWYGGNEVLHGRLSAGDLVAFLFYAQNIAGSISDLTSHYTNFNSAAGASERVFELLAMEPEVRERPDALTLGRSRGRVELRNVWFAYDEGRTVLQGIDLTIEPGQTVALVGRSGAGKSTLTNLIPRLFDPIHGTIHVDGHDIRDLTLQSLRDNIAVVSQDVQLFHTTVADNIRYGRLDATDAEVRTAAAQANALAFIEALPQGFDTVVGESGTKLSGGQRQRISIARALLRDAPILLLDEATSSVDAESEAAIHDALDRLRRQRTTLVIAHRLATVRDADRIVVIDAGQIVEDGTHAALMAQSGLYGTLATLQLADAATAA